MDDRPNHEKDKVIRKLASVCHRHGVQVVGMDGKWEVCVWDGRVWGLAFDGLGSHLEALMVGLDIVLGKIEGYVP